MHLKYAEMFVIVVHENMKLGEISYEIWEALKCKHTICDQILANCSRYFTASWNSETI